jgi:TatD DNase family protein
MSSVAYQIKNSLYLNITNRCTNACTFCIRYIQKLFNGKHPLWLIQEPTAEELWAAIGNPACFDEIVFCGYGEPLLRLDLVKLLCEKIVAARGKNRQPKIRIDTNGQASLFYMKNILPELKELVDEIQISLNAENAQPYETLCRPLYGTKAYPAILAFTREAKKHIPRVILSAVDLPSINKEACRQVAKQLEVDFKIRPYYEEKYKR